MKIMHIVDKYPGKAEPKQDKYPLIYHSMVDRGHMICMIVHSSLCKKSNIISAMKAEWHKNDKNESFVIEAKFHIFALKILNVITGGIAGRFIEKVTSPIATIQGYKAAAEYINIFGKPDIIHAWGERDWIAIKIATKIQKRFSVPIVWNVHHIGAFMSSDPINRQPKKAKNFLKQVDCLAPVSENLLSQWIRLYPRDMPALKTSIPNPVNEKYFVPSHKNTSSEPIKFFHISKLNKFKNIPMMLKAFSVLYKGKNKKLMMAGQHRLPNDIIIIIRDLGLRDQVINCGRLDPQQVAQIFRETDVYLQSSDLETFCIPVAEALMAGVPVVSTRTAGPSSLIKDFCGELADVGDLESYINALQNVEKKFASYNRERIRNYAINTFGIDAFCNKCENVYNSVLQSYAK